MDMFGRHSILKLFCLLLGLFFVAPIQAETYQCKDESGTPRFQDHPCDGAVAQPANQTSASSQTHSTTASGKHFLWQASAGNGTLYLLGSIHFGTSDMYPLPMVITSSFKQSDALVVEADILSADPVELAQMVSTKAMYQDGSTLHQYLSAETSARLQQVSVSLGIPVEMLDMQKPWFVSMSLTALALNKLGFSEDMGIDAHFLSLAKGKKKVIELEGMAWQLALFDQLTTEEQVMMLEETLREIEHGKEFFDKMLRYWRAGDGEGVQELFDEGVMSLKDSGRLNQIIMIDRNRSMTDKLHALAQQGGKYFVVVGAGHLPGDQGIVALLKQRGYRIEQL